MSAAEQNEYESDVLTVDEVAAKLRVTRALVYTMIRRKKLPGVRRMGRVIRVSRAAIDQWIAEGDSRPGRPRETP